MMEPANGFKLSRTPVQVNPEDPGRPFLDSGARGGVGASRPGKFLPGQGTAANLVGPERIMA